MSQRNQVASFTLPSTLVRRILVIAKYTASNKASSPLHFTRLEFQKESVILFATNGYVAAMEEFYIPYAEQFSFNLEPEAIRFLRSLPKKTEVTLKVLQSNKVEIVPIGSEQMSYMTSLTDSRYVSWRAIIPNTVENVIVLPVEVRRFMCSLKKHNLNVVEIDRKCVSCFCDTPSQKSEGDTRSFSIPTALNSYRLRFNFSFLLKVWEADKPLTIKLAGQNQPAMIYYPTLPSSCKSQWRMLMPLPQKVAS